MAITSYNANNEKKLVKKHEHKSPYLVSDKIQLLSRLTAEKRVFQKKTLDYISSFPLAANIYKATSGEFKSLKRANKKKVKKSVYTLPNAPARAPQTCTASDMNDSEYYSQSNENNPRLKKRTAIKNVRKPVNKNKDYLYYDRDARYCSQYDINLDRSSTDLIKNHRGDCGRNPNYTLQKGCKPNKNEQNDPTKPNSVWAVLRSLNRFPFHVSPPMSDESLPRAKKKKAKKKRVNCKNARLLETCHTEEIAYSISYDVDNNSGSITQSSSFDRVTVIEKDDDCTKLYKDIEVRLLKNQNSGNSNDLDNRVQSNSVAKTKKKAIKKGTVKALRAKPLETNLDSAESINNFSIKILSDKESDSTSRNIAIRRDLEYLNHPVLNRNDDNVDYFDYSKDSLLTYFDNSGSSKAELALNASNKLKEKHTLVGNPHASQRKIISKLNLGSTPESALSPRSNRQYEINTRKSRLVTTMPSACMLPKFTLTEIKNKLASMRFPIVVLGKEQVSSSIEVHDYDHPQFNGLDKHIWPFMVKWDETNKFNQVELARQNNYTNLIDRVNGKNNNFDLNTNVRKTNKFYNENIANPKSNKHDENTRPSVLYPEITNQLRQCKNKKAVVELKEKMLNLLYEKISNGHIINDNYKQLSPNIPPNNKYLTEYIEHPVKHGTIEKPDDFVRSPVNRRIIEKPDDVVRSPVNRRTIEILEDFVRSPVNRRTIEKPDDFVRSPVNRKIIEKPDDFVRSPVNRKIKEKPDDFVRSPLNRRTIEILDDFVRSPVNRKTIEKPDDFVRSPVNRKTIEKPDDFVRSSFNRRTTEKPDDFVRSPVSRRTIEESDDLIRSSDQSSITTPSHSATPRVRSPVKTQQKTRYHDMTRPWAKTKKTHDLIENIINKIKDGVYFNQENMKPELNMTEVAADIAMQTDDSDTLDISPKVTILKKQSTTCSIPGFDNTLPGLEIKTLNGTQIVIKHCVRDIMMQFDLTVPTDVNKAEISPQMPTPLVPVEITENQTKIFKYKSTLLNAMLPAELCSILPKLMRLMDPATKSLRPLCSGLINKAQLNLSTITELSCKVNNSCTPMVIEEPLQSSVSPIVHPLPAVQKLLGGMFSSTHKILTEPVEYKCSRLYAGLLDKPISNVFFLHDCTPIYRIKSPFVPKLSQPKETLIVSPILKKECIPCTALELYSIKNKSLVQPFKPYRFEDVIMTILNKTHISNLRPTMTWSTNMLTMLYDSMKNVNPCNTAVSDNEALEKKLCVTVYDLKINYLNSKDVEKSETKNNEQIERSANHNSGFKDKLSTEFRAPNNKNKRKGFYRLYRKCKSATNVCIPPVEKGVATSQLNKIQNLDDFFEILGSKKLSAVFDGYSERKILSSVVEMKNWITDINPAQAMLLLLLTNKKDTPNLVRFRPILLQGIAVNRITRATELDMEIEVIERENIHKFSEYEGILPWPASVQDDNQLLEELYWIAKTTASDYQKPFDDSSERLLKSLLEKRKKLNPSYLRVMARYVGLGLLKTPLKK